MIDENVPQATTIELRQTGFDVQTVVDKMPSASDEDVLNYSIASGRLLVTADSDLNRLVYLNNWHVPDGLILNRDPWPIFTGRLVWALVNHGRENMVMVFGRNEVRATAPLPGRQPSREAVRHQYVKRGFPSHLAMKRHI